jgi:protein-disulfide isomerase
MHKDDKEPKIVIRPIGKFGGLDNIHIALIILVAILIGLLAIISYSKPQVVFMNQSSNTSSLCANQISQLNASYQKPLHTEAEVLNYTKRIIATYNFININSSLGVYIPFYSYVNEINLSYMPSLKEWHAVVPVLDPATNSTFFVSFDIYDSNLTLAKSYIETISPSKVLNYMAVSKGVILIPGKFACSTNSSVNVFWFMDPYAPGSVYSLEYIPKLESEFGKNVNITVKILYGEYTDLMGSRYGITNAQYLGKYILCASQQKNFTNFIINLNAIYSNNYMSNQTLYSIAKFSDLNMSMLNSCIQNSTTLINRQALLAEYFNITTTPSVVVNCNYLTIPQTAYEGVCFTNPNLCK